jgi:hypothetical protein
MLLLRINITDLSRLISDRAVTRAREKPRRKRGPGADLESSTTKCLGTIEIRKSVEARSEKNYSRFGSLSSIFSSDISNSRDGFLRWLYLPSRKDLLRASDPRRFVTRGKIP